MKQNNGIFRCLQYLVDFLDLVDISNRHIFDTVKLPVGIHE